MIVIFKKTLYITRLTRHKAHSVIDSRDQNVELNSGGGVAELNLKGRGCTYENLDELLKVTNLDVA